MGQFSNVLLAIDKAHTAPQRALDCIPGLGELNQVYGPNHPTLSICGKYINIFIRCTNRNQYDILMTAAADVSKGQTDMPCKGELQTMTKLSIRHLVCPGEDCCTIILLMSRGRGNCVTTYYISLSVLFVLFSLSEMIGSTWKGGGTRFT